MSPLSSDEIAIISSHPEMVDELEDYQEACMMISRATEDLEVALTKRVVAEEQLLDLLRQIGRASCRERV